MHDDEPGQESPPAPHDQFPATNWGMVSMASQGPEHERLQALNSLVTAYYPGLKNYVHYQFQVSKGDAEDYLQEFLLDKIIKKEILTVAAKERGQFRNFLRKALNRHVIDSNRRAHAAKRSPKKPLISLDEIPPQSLHAPSEHGFEQFDKEFAAQVITRTLKRMKETCLATDRAKLWELFSNRIVGSSMNGEEPLPYKKLVPLLGLDSERQISSLLTKAKELFTQTLREVVGEYESDPLAIQNEINALREVLSIYH